MTPEINVSLTQYTSLHVGGPARFFCRIMTETDVYAALQFARQEGLPYFVLGKGSNTLFSDEGFSGVILYMANREITIEGNGVSAASGAFMRPLVNKALAAGLRGLEELAGIPGTVGGAVRGNAGTWQTEIKDVLATIDIVKPQGEGWQKVSLPSSECAFGYRDSIFKHQPTWIIMRAHFALQAGDPHSGEALVQKDLQLRHQKQPYTAPSAGSVFKNPDKERGFFSGALIEKAGLKGLRIGGAQISEKHANFILNTGGATSRDIRKLMTRAQQEVKDRFDVELEPEIVVVE